MQFAPRTVVVALVLGVVVTAVSALGPALKAVRIPPVAALQSVAAPPPPKLGRGRLVLGGLVTAAGVALLVFGLFDARGVAVVGAGAATVMIGVALLSPLVTRPLVALMGWPVTRAFGIRGELARANALRNPRRTAATASALMIGLGLVTFVMIFAASITASASSAIDDVYTAEYTVAATAAGSIGAFPPALADRLQALPEVAQVNRMRFTEFRYDGKTMYGFGLDPAAIAGTFSVDTLSGAMEDLSQGGLAVKANIAEAEGWQVGDVASVQFAATGRQQLPVRAIWDGAVDTDWIMDNGTITDNMRGARDQQILVKLADGVSVAEARPALRQVLEPFPTAVARDQTEQKEEITDQVNQLLALMSALLLLSVVIALFGIVNTLALSVYERVRELGLLRAIGMTRRQMRAMIRWESVLIALLGAVFGLGIGVVFGWMMTRALQSQGNTEFALPGVQLVAAVVFAAVAGVAAAILPARRAARVDILRAVAAE